MWIKMGHIFSVDGMYEWNKSHAQVPVVDVLQDRLRIYYSTRNSVGQSNISYVEVDKKDPSVILFKSENVILELGKLGTFDETGLMPSCIITIGHKKYLYYIGWTTKLTVPYHNAIGLAVSLDGGSTFKKYSDGPIITINHFEPYFSGTCFVMKHKDSLRMWYLSCIGWENVEGRQEALYNIKYANSQDGINWEQRGTVAIPLESDEGGLASASVLKEGSMFKMWYARRKKSNFREDTSRSYRIGYAESLDGKEWVRHDDKAGIKISNKGWDSEMISYPYIVEVNKSLLMFYNGNGFGKSGFGYAIWKYKHNNK